MSTNAWRLYRPVLVALVVVALSGISGRARSAEAAQPVQAASLTCGPAMGPSPVLPADDALAAALSTIAERVEMIRTSRAIAGLAVGIVAGQDVIFAQGFGCASLDPPVATTPQTVYEMASNTKSFTAVMLMQLRDAGRLQLDDPVNQYVPAVVYQAPDGRLVSPTFRQLAAHISGLPRDMRPAPASVEQLFQRLPQVVAESDPGTEYLYSNLGYAVLGQALAVIAGQPYAQYVAEHILQPLGMSSSGFDRSAIQAPIATGYTSIEVTPDGVMAQPARYASLGPGNPSGGLLSSLADMTQFVKLQFADGPVGGSQILSGASLREMWEPVFPTNGPGSATVGWFVSPFGSQTLVCKNGALPGFHTQVCFLPQSQVGVVILANVATRLLTGPAGLQRMAQMILTTVLPALSPPATSS